MTTHRKGIAAYLLIAFGLTWSMWEIVIRMGVSIGNPRFRLLAGPSVFGPAVAAFIVRKWVTREGFADAGLKLHLRRWPYYLVALLLPAVGAGFILVAAPILGVGTPDLSLKRGIDYLVGSGVATHKLQHPFLLMSLLPLQAILAMPILFGEEFGWRGYLQPRLLPARPVVGAIITGLIWAAWHLPVNLRGYNFPQNPLLGALVLFPIGSIFLSIIFGWLFVKTGSVWSASLAHSATNVIAGTIILLLLGGGGNLIFISYAGVLGLIPLGALSAWIVFTGQSTPPTTKVVQAEQQGHAAMVS